MNWGFPTKRLDRLILAAVFLGLAGLLIAIAFFDIVVARFYFSAYTLAFGASMLAYTNQNKKLLTVVFLVAGFVWLAFNIYIHAKFPTAA